MSNKLTNEQINSVLTFNELVLGAATDEQRLLLLDIASNYMCRECGRLTPMKDDGYVDQCFCMMDE